MRRHLFSIAAGTSVVGFFVITLIYIRSFKVRDDLGLKLSTKHVVFVESARGKLRLMSVYDNFGIDYSSLDMKQSSAHLSHHRPAERFDDMDWHDSWGWEWHRGAFEIGSSHYIGLNSMQVLTAPYWSVQLATLLFPMVLIRTQFRRNRRLKLGLCPRCGYDVRANSDRCSECGEKIVGQSIAR